MNYKKLTNGFVRSRVKDASQKSLDLFLGNESSAEEYDRCKEMAQIIDDWIEEGRQGITYKEVVDYLTQEGFVHYKDASPKREYWTTKNRLTTAGLMIMHTNKGNGELENEIVYICDFVSNIPALPKALLGDSRRVKDGFLKSETVQETVAKLKVMCPNYDEIIENNYSGEKSYIPTLGEVVREARTGDTVAQRCLAEIKRCGNISDSRRVKDEFLKFTFELYPQTTEQFVSNGERFQSQKEYNSYDECYNDAIATAEDYYYELLDKWGEYAVSSILVELKKSSAYETGEFFDTFRAFYVEPNEKTGVLEVI